VFTIRVVTGPTKPIWEIGPAPRLEKKLIEDSFENQLNAKLSELARQGARIGREDVEFGQVGEQLAAFISVGADAPAATLSIQQTARRLGVGRSTVSDMIHGKRLHAVQIGRQWRVPCTEVDRLLMAGA
jgi:excisionase family DNA binding protein